MIRNFLTIALRNFMRQRFYSVLNIIGLASGLVCSLFIFLWVNDEVSKDRFHQDSENIFRIVSNLKLRDGEVITWSITPGPLAEDIRENVPEIQFAARTIHLGPELLQNGDRSFMEKGVYADADLFKIFSFNIVMGKPSADSADVSHISISESLAKKLFGQDDPLGKTVNVSQGRDYNVAVVFEDVGGNSSLQFDYVLPFEVFKQTRGEGFNWDNYDHPLYVKLHDPAQAQKAIDRINDRRDRMSKAKAEDDDVDFYIQPFTESYLHGRFINGQPAGGRIEYVRMFSVVAVFILVIACINFMNMATAKATTRSKEVGIRKVVGAQRKSLVFQFIGESMILCSVAMLLAIGMVYSTLPLFNTLVSKQIVIDLSDHRFLLAAFSITMITGLLAGCYPAFFLSAYQPVRVLKGSPHGGSGGGALRRGLVVFQFTLTVVLIASSMVIYRQVGFIMNKNLGYEKTGVLSFAGTHTFLKAYENFRNEAMQFPAVTNISRSNESLVQVNNQNSSVDWPGKPEESDQFFRTVVVDYGFLETLNVKLEEGRFFSQQHNDTSNFILTRRAIEVMGLEDPIGQTISQWGMSGKVVGVVNDIHSRSLYEAIDPVVFMCKPEWTSRVFVAFEGSKTREVIAHVENVYKKYSPGYPFDYSFIEDDFENLYNNEKVTAALALGFTLMAVLISGLGLLGLAAYTAERKRKEISIRRTLGATVSGIVGSITGDFAKLTAIAIAIGIPIAWWVAGKFLEEYAYHMSLGWEIFAFTALIVLFIAVITVIYQVTKAALANPVDTLRNE